MKNKTIFYLVLFAGLAVFQSGCFRSSVDDPAVTGQSGSRLILEAYANPSVLYIPQTLIPQVSTIVVKVSSYDGLPLAGRQVLFQQFEGNAVTGMSWGQFEGNVLSAKRTLDSQGSTQIGYLFPCSFTVSQDTLIFIKVTLLNIDALRAEICDFVPIYLKVYAN